MVGWQQEKLEDVPLPVGSHALPQCNGERASRSAIGDLKWVQDHVPLYGEDSLGVAWKWSMVCAPAAQREHWRVAGQDGMSTLVDRELEGLGLQDLNLPWSAENETALDLSQVNSRWNLKLGSVSCLSPGAKMLLLHRMRFVAGIEFLRLQGIWLDNEDALFDTFGEQMLCDLGGNAFHTLPCVACLVAAMVALSVVECDGLEGLLEASGAS